MFPGLSDIRNCEITVICGVIIGRSDRVVRVFGLGFYVANIEEFNVTCLRAISILLSIV